jgi:hypothetical protein
MIVHFFIYNIIQPPPDFGVQPTCSVSIIKSAPAGPATPLLSVTHSRKQYEVPGCRLAASAWTFLLAAPIGILLEAAVSQAC